MFSAATFVLALAATVTAQGVTSAISPPGSTPAGCSTSQAGTFQITVVNVTTLAKREIVKRDALTLTLAGGILKDAQSRIGYVADNFQFQFDGPPQAGALYTAGFSLCANGSLALGGKAIWYQCLSGGFYNLYDRNWAPQCSPIYIVAIGTSAAPVAASVSQRVDGQPIATTVVSQITDGQVIVKTMTVPVSQISDGQIQNPTGAPKVTSSVARVSQLSDGQVNAPKATVQQLSDGQIIATPPAVISSPKVTGAPVTQISDGQVQAPTSGATTVRANSTVASTTARVSAFTGAAAPRGVSLVSAGALALVAAFFASCL